MAQATPGLDILGYSRFRGVRMDGNWLEYDGIQHPLAYRAYNPYIISPSKTIASLGDERKLDEFYNF